MSTPHPFLHQTLVDTSAFYALTDSKDKNHETAVAIRDRLLGEKWRLFTTNIILIEMHALILSRLGRAVALQVIQHVDRSNTTIVRVSPADEHAARRILAQYYDKDFALADATSFAVMKRLGISSAFTFDRHFAQYGLTIVSPDQP